MGGMSSSFGGLGDAIQGVAEVAAPVADIAAVATGNPELAPDLWSTLAPAAISAGTSLASSALGYSGTQDQINAAQANQASANAFSASQYASRYQTTVKDLMAAGLNPMLAYSQGAGNSPTAQAAPTFNKWSQASGHISEAATKAIGAANVAMDTQQKNANVTNTIAATTLTEQQAKLVDAQAQKTRLEAISELIRQPGIPESIKLTIAQTFLAEQQKRTSSATEGAIRQDINIKGPEEWSAKEYGKGKQGFKDIIEGVTSAAGAANAIKGRPAPIINKNNTIQHYYPQGQ